MITTKLYLDRRAVKEGQDAPVKLQLNSRGKTALLNLGIRLNPRYWNARKSIVTNHPESLYLNNLFARKKIEAEKALYSLLEEDEQAYLLSITDIKNAVARKIDPNREDKLLFAAFFRRCIAEQQNKRTAEIYQATLNRICAFSKNAERMRFEDVSVEWLQKFDSFMIAYAPSRNARNIHLRNIRAVVNCAIKARLTTHYAFGAFQIRNEETKKRALPLDVLRMLMTCKVVGKDSVFLDVFRLSFFLIGINMIDLCRLTAIESGRIEYIRAKTKRHYSVLVLGEAQAIIQRLRGKKKLLAVAEEYSSYKEVTKRVNRVLKRLTGNNEVSTYWARHSWATIAAKIDVPKETISAALGHGGHSVTDIYIDFDLKKVDAANRRVINYVLHSEKALK